MGSFERARRRREERAAQKARRGPTPASAPGAAGRQDTLSIYSGSPYGNVPDIELCHPPIHVGPELAPRSDPLAVLGLDPARRATPDEVRAAFQRVIQDHPPEREPETARAAIEARDRLLRPERAIERELGVVYMPDPDKYGLTTEALPQAPKPTTLPSEGRLMATLALYALLEAELGPA